VVQGKYFLEIFVANRECLFSGVYARGNTVCDRLLLIKQNRPLARPVSGAKEGV
jgi:hypothetical protein